jgi:hypothetical protein
MSMENDVRTFAGSMVSLGALTLVIALTAAGQGRGGGDITSPFYQPPVVKGDPVTHLPDGQPDMQGYWMARAPNAINDIETTAARPKIGIRAGKGVIVDPPDGKIPYLPGAREKEEDLSERHMVEESDAHCYMAGIPHQMFSLFGFQILQPPGYVVMIWEFNHAYRIIPLDGRPHIAANIKLFEGDSRGHWEGNTLVVDVTNQNARTWIDMAADYHSDSIHVVERFTPTDSRNIAYEATIEDPKVYSMPWKIAFSFGRNETPNYQNMEFSCHEGEHDVQQFNK